MILVTGGAGFIGSNFILQWLADSSEPVLNLDVLTYAGNPDNLAWVADHPAYQFVRGDIGDRPLVRSILADLRPRAIVHCAAETHVDRSIGGPARFVATNVSGTLALLEVAHAWWTTLDATRRDAFRFLHVSTDEVYGSLDADDASFTEATRFAPNSPYAASKAGADHLVRAWRRTFGLPTLSTHCSNNYGPRQYPEKLIPLVVTRALAGNPIPVYGDGANVRDWLHVDDHCTALRAVLARGRPGETYNIGGGSEVRNIDIVQRLCDILDRLAPREGVSHRSLIRMVADRPGHDRRYAIDSGKISNELDWRPRVPFAAGLEQTVRWYIDHPEWVERIRAGAHARPRLATPDARVAS